MSWIRSTSISFARQLTNSLDPRHDYEPQACYSSFCKHWQQAHDVITKSQLSHLHEDVLSVVSHLEQLGTLLELEAKAREITIDPSPADCLEYLLSENLLDKLYEWMICTGKYENAVRLEELKLFGILVRHYSSQIIAAEPFLRPLLKLLSRFRTELPPFDRLESQLVTVLSQLCVALIQNRNLIDLFFLTNHAENGSHAEFIIVRLLLTSVHREGRIGATARDALLLCAKMSARSNQLAEFMLVGNTCPILATGLSGLYSLLPRTLPEKTHRLSSDDVNQVNKLTLFIDSLEFCNAVAQVAHPSIKKHLLDLLYQGFLVPVMGPALLQTKADALQSGDNEQAAAMAYLELLLRCVSERGILRTVLHFLFVYEYDGVRVVDVLLSRLEGDSQLSLVSLALMETLISLNCEDVMIELVYKYLLTGQHLVTSQRHKITHPEPYRDAAVAFLSLTPNCCSRPLEKTRQWVEELALSGRKVLEYKREDERRVNGVYESIAMGNLVQDKLNYGNPNETLLGNYHAYLCDARFELVSRTIACANWTSKYDCSTKRETNNNKETREIDTTHTKEQDSLISICTSEYDTLKTSDTSEKEPHSLTSLNDHVEEVKVEGSDEKEIDDSDVKEIDNSDVKEHDSLISSGDSDCDSLYRDGDDSEVYAEEIFRKSLGNVEETRDNEEVTTVRTWRRSADTIIGPLLSSLLNKSAAFLKSDVTVNSTVTSIICKLASLPTPLLTSLLLCPSYIIQPNVPSLYQILSKLKEEVDELTDDNSSTGELVDKARVFLMQREASLVTARAPTNDDNQAHTHNSPALRSDDSPFKRAEPKRRSLSSSIFGSNIFGKKQSLSPSPSPQKRPIFTDEAYWSQSVTLCSILNAVLLDEWLKELAALCEEHALKLSADYYEDDSYIKSVAL